MSTRRVDWVLSALLALVAVALICAMLPIRVDPVLRLELSKNATPIQDLDQPRSIVSTQTRWVDVLDLARDGQLAHPKLGAVGLGEHYFLDLETRIRVVHSGSFRFEVSSDDGFALMVGERRICAHTGDRPLRTQSCRVLLLAGEHVLRLSYFQGGGPAGLAVRYSVDQDNDQDTHWYWLGQDSPRLQFLRD